MKLPVASVLLLICVAYAVPIEKDETDASSITEEAAPRNLNFGDWIQDPIYQGTQPNIFNQHAYNNEDVIHSSYITGSGASAVNNLIPSSVNGYQMVINEPYTIETVRGYQYGNEPPSTMVQQLPTYGNLQIETDRSTNNLYGSSASGYQVFNGESPNSETYGASQVVEQFPGYGKVYVQSVPSTFTYDKRPPSSVPEQGPDSDTLHVQTDPSSHNFNQLPLENGQVNIAENTYLQSMGIPNLPYPGLIRRVPVTIVTEGHAYVVLTANGTQLLPNKFQSTGGHFITGTDGRLVNQYYQSNPYLVQQQMGQNQLIYNQYPNFQPGMNQFIRPDGPGLEQFQSQTQHTGQNPSDLNPLQQQTVYHQVFTNKYPNFEPGMNQFFRPDGPGLEQFSKPPTPFNISPGFEKPQNLGNVISMEFDTTKSYEELCLQIGDFVKRVNAKATIYLKVNNGQYLGRIRGTILIHDFENPYLNQQQIILLAKQTILVDGSLILTSKYNIGNDIGRITVITPIATEELRVPGESQSVDTVSTTEKAKDNQSTINVATEKSTEAHVTEVPTSVDTVSSTEKVKGDGPQLLFPTSNEQLQNKPSKSFLGIILEKGIQMAKNFLSQFSPKPPTPLNISPDFEKHEYQDFANAISLEFDTTKSYEELCLQIIDFIQRVNAKATIYLNVNNGQYVGRIRGTIIIDNFQKPYLNKQQIILLAKQMILIDDSFILTEKHNINGEIGRITVITPKTMEEFVVPDELTSVDTVSTTESVKGNDPQSTTVTTDKSTESPATAGIVFTTEEAKDDQSTTVTAEKSTDSPVTVVPTSVDTISTTEAVKDDDPQSTTITTDKSTESPDAAGTDCTTEEGKDDQSSTGTTDIHTESPTTDKQTTSVTIITSESDSGYESTRVTNIHPTEQITNTDNQSTPTTTDNSTESPVVTSDIPTSGAPNTEPTRPTTNSHSDVSTSSTIADETTTVPPSDNYVSTVTDSANIISLEFDTTKSYEELCLQIMDFIQRINGEATIYLNVNNGQYLGRIRGTILIHDFEHSYLNQQQIILLAKQTILVDGSLILTSKYNIDSKIEKITVITPLTMEEIIVSDEPTSVDPDSTTEKVKDDQSTPATTLNSTESPVTTQDASTSRAPNTEPTRPTTNSQSDVSTSSTIADETTTVPPSDNYVTTVTNSDNVISLEFDTTKSYEELCMQIFDFIQRINAKAMIYLNVNNGQYLGRIRGTILIHDFEHPYLNQQQIILLAKQTILEDGSLILTSKYNIDSEIEKITVITPLTIEEIIVSGEPTSVDPVSTTEKVKNDQSTPTTTDNFTESPVTTPDVSTFGAPDTEPTRPTTNSQSDVTTSSTIADETTIERLSDNYVSTVTLSTTEKAKDDQSIPATTDNSTESPVTTSDVSTSGAPDTEPTRPTTNSHSDVFTSSTIAYETTTVPPSDNYVTTVTYSDNIISLEFDTTKSYEELCMQIFDFIQRINAKATIYLNVNNGQYLGRIRGTILIHDFDHSYLNQEQIILLAKQTILVDGSLILTSKYNIESLSGKITVITPLTIEEIIVSGEPSSVDPVSTTEKVKDDQSTPTTTDNYTESPVTTPDVSTSGAPDTKPTRPTTNSHSDVFTSSTIAYETTTVPPSDNYVTTVTYSDNIISLEFDTTKSYEELCMQIFDFIKRINAKAMIYLNVNNGQYLGRIRGTILIHDFEHPYLNQQQIILLAKQTILVDGSLILTSKYNIDSEIEKITVITPVSMEEIIVSDEPTSVDPVSTTEKVKDDQSTPATTDNSTESPVTTSDVSTSGAPDSEPTQPTTNSQSDVSTSSTIADKTTTLPPSDNYVSTVTLSTTEKAKDDQSTPTATDNYTESPVTTPDVSTSGAPDTEPTRPTTNSHSDVSTSSTIAYETTIVPLSDNYVTTVTNSDNVISLEFDTTKSYEELCMQILDFIQRINAKATIYLDVNNGQYLGRIRGTILIHDFDHSYLNQEQIILLAMQTILVDGSLILTSKYNIESLSGKITVITPLTIEEIIVSGEPSSVDPVSTTEKVKNDQSTPTTTDNYTESPVTTPDVSTFGAPDTEPTRPTTNSHSDVSTSSTITYETTTVPPSDNYVTTVTLSTTEKVRDDQSTPTTTDNYTKLPVTTPDVSTSGAPDTEPTRPTTNSQSDVSTSSTIADETTTVPPSDSHISTVTDSVPSETTQQDNKSTEPANTEPTTHQSTPVDDLFSPDVSVAVPTRQPTIDLSTSTPKDITHKNIELIDTEELWNLVFGEEIDIENFTGSAEIIVSKYPSVEEDGATVHIYIDSDGTNVTTYPSSWYSPCLCNTIS